MENGDEAVKGCGNSRKMRILFGTTNESKLRSMRRITEDLGIELIGLSDLHLPLPQIEESGRDILKNAELKAHACFLLRQRALF